MAGPPRSSFRILNTDRLARRLAELARGTHVTREVAATLYQEAEAVMAESKRLVPVDTGALRSSGFVVPPEIEGASVRVELSYGGPSAPYAVIQHERLDLHHTVGQAKFLEQPLTEARSRVLAKLGEAIERGMRKASSTA